MSRLTREERENEFLPSHVHDTSPKRVDLCNVAVLRDSLETNEVKYKVFLSLN